MYKFTKNTSQKIKERDSWRCINCLSPFLCPSAHHVYFHHSERVWDDTANDVDKGVALCSHCHIDLHAGNKEIDKKCHDYLQKTYKKD